MNATLSTAERVEIELACRRLVYVYMRALDGGDADGAADCFAESGAMARPMQPDQLLHGRENIRSSLKTRPKGLVTCHLATNVVIDVTSPETATGLTTMAFIGCMPTEAAKRPYESAGPLYFGEFRDRFARVAGAWKFLERLGSIAMKY